MRRRDFLLLAGATAVWSLPALVRAQQPRGDKRRLAYLSNLAKGDPVDDARRGALLDGLARLGWTTGVNLIVDTLWQSGQPLGVDVLAKELLANNPDVVIAATTDATIALMAATRTTPIVMIAVTDPAGQGLVASLDHPGGNVTGSQQFEASIGGKWIEYLLEVAPSLDRIGLLHNPDRPSNAYFFRGFDALDPPPKVTLIKMPVRSAAEIDAMYDDLARRPGAGVIAISDAFLAATRATVVAAEARTLIPTMWFNQTAVTDGVLIGYGPDTVELSGEAATTVDQILRGVSPADIPVQTPTRLQLSINLKTAKTLGIAVPQAVLARADALIE